MATWQDGPEYAPLERPDEFAVPEVAPLETAPAPPARPRSPAARPAFAGPPAPVSPLETLVPAPADRRDPERPFDVVSSTLTTPGAWAGVHGSVPHEVAPQPAGPAPWPVQGWTYGDSGAAGYPGAHHPGDLTGQNGFPAPGTPEWFGPGAYGEQPSASGRVDARQVLSAVTPGLLICLGLGVLILPLAPILVVLAFVLCRRVRVAQTQVHRTFAIALGSLGAFAVIGLLSSPLGFADWWDMLSFWSRLVCGVTAVVATVQVWGRLKSRSTRPLAPPPGYRGPGG